MNILGLMIGQARPGAAIYYHHYPPAPLGRTAVEDALWSVGFVVCCQGCLQELSPEIVWRSCLQELLEETRDPLLLLLLAAPGPSAREGMFLMFLMSLGPWVRVFSGASNPNSVPDSCVKPLVF